MTPTDSSLAVGTPLENVQTPRKEVARGDVACECGCGERFAYRRGKRFAGGRCRVTWHRQMRDERDEQIRRMIRALYDAAVGSRG